MASNNIMSDTDHARISAAVRAAEAGTAGEIVTIIADSSDDYGDVALWWAVIFGVMALASLAVFPGFYSNLLAKLSGGWASAMTIAEAFELALAIFVVIFVAVRLLLLWMPLRRWFTPNRIKANRVRQRALGYFKVGAESRTSGRTGILIYLSMSEHIAEIVADQAIHGKVAPEAWGEAMAKLVGEVREGRVADGMVAAIVDVGAILSTHFPRADNDVNELPDRVIEL